MKPLTHSIKLLSLLILVSILFFSCDEDDNDANKKYIGVTLPLTGESPLDIEAQQAAVELAIVDVNAYFDENKIALQIEADIQDTENTPEGFMAALNHYTEQKVEFVASAGISQNLSDSELTLNAFEGAVIHSTSTSAMLSKADNLFRIIPDDVRTAKEISDKLMADNIKELIIMNRSDFWGKKLSEALKSSFNSEGVNVHIIEYEARFIPDCIADAIVTTLAQLKESKKTVSANEIAIAALAFNEIDEILTVAAENDELLNVKWYGSDGYILNNRLTENETLAQIASKVGLYCPAIATPDNSAYQDAEAKVAAKIGYTPRTNNLLIYDAVWAAAIALSKNATSPQAAVKEALSESHYIFGNYSLNDNGDNTDCDYQYWYIANNGGYAWQKVD